MTSSTEKLPEWMLKLESKQKKQHRLAHDIGAGAPCLACGDNCPGLDLHFWRKLCRNCKCKKEDHDVKDDEGYEQFDILLGSGSRKTKKGGFLNIKVPDDTQKTVAAQNTSSRGVSFDWLPPNVSEEVAAEYMQQLPVSKLPISGSDGALYRRQQLTKQVPLHDLDAKHCHNLTPEEIEQLMKYLENLKNNVVGQGCVGKVPALYSETITTVPGVEHFYAVDQVTGRQLISSQSADPIRPLPPMPPAYNSMPRPFHASTSSSAYGSGEDEDLPPPLPTSLPPRTDLKIPSEFMPDWRLPEDHIFGKVMEGMQDMQLNQVEFPSSCIHESFASGTTASSKYDRQQSEFSSNLLPSRLPSSKGSHHESISSQAGLSQTYDQGRSCSESTLGSNALQNTVGEHSASSSGSMLEHSDKGKQPTAQFGQSVLNRKQEALTGARMPTGVAVNITDVNTEGIASSFPVNSIQVSSLHSRGIVNSSAIDPLGNPLMTKPLSEWKNVDSNTSSLNSISGSGILPSSDSNSSLLQANSSSSIPPVGGSGVQELSIPHSQSSISPQIAGSSLSSAGHPTSDSQILHLSPNISSSVGPSGGTEMKGLHPHESRLPSNIFGSLGTDKGVGIRHDPQSMLLTPNVAVNSEAVGGIRSIAEPLKGRRPGSNSGISSGNQEQFTEEDVNCINSLSGYGTGKKSVPQTTQLNYGRPGLNQHILPSTLPVEGVKTSSIIAPTVVQSSSVATDALPKSAQMMQQQPKSMDPALPAPFHGSAAPLPAETPGGSSAHLDCRQCGLKLLAGDVAVFAERAGSAAWHPSCFVCSTCEELLVDLVYFYHKSNVYCGRHYAELMGIPRCCACDELIFVKEYTIAEEKAYHIKHFCCYECDDPLANKQYISVEDQSVCLECFDHKYGKKCHTCKNRITASEQRLGWKHLNWHVQGNCFRCYECAKSLLGGRFVVKEDQPFCSKECVQAGLQKMAGAA
ncbi:hypothetical protein R5R35_014011 [Gryllus longicercus]|uniref:Testin n=1 Tax=Gryllus longicercus TaxID=2509291 RepID=A0AAN9VXF4_9ORTH